MEAVEPITVISSPLALDLDPQNTETGLFTMEGDALYGTGEAFDRGISRMRLYHGEMVLSEGIICRSIFCISLRSRRGMNRYGQSLASISGGLLRMETPGLRFDSA